MGTVEQEAELIEADPGLHRNTAAVLDAPQFQGQRLLVSVLDPADYLQRHAVQEAGQHLEVVLHHLLVFLRQLLVQTIKGKASSFLNHFR